MAMVNSRLRTRWQRRNPKGKNVMNKQVLKLGARILENLPNMSSEVVQGWIDNPKALQDFLCRLASQEKVPETYLRHLLSLTIAPTKGSVTIAEASAVFTGYLDPDFKNWGTNQPGLDTQATEVDVRELKKDGTYQQVFGSLGRKVRSLCLSQPQIVEFCQTHREHLRQDGYATFFLFEASDDLFVAYVGVDGGSLEARVFRFLDVNVWYAVNRRRLVVRQQSV